MWKKRLFIKKKTAECVWGFKATADLFESNKQSKNGEQYDRVARTESISEVIVIHWPRLRRLRHYTDYLIHPAST